MLDFSQSVVLITGASRGLGKAFAQCLADAGAIVAVNNSTPNENGLALVDAITSKGGRAIYTPGPVEAGAELIEQVVEKTGRIDAVVHNAGFVRDKTLRKMTTQQWDEVQNVHLKSAFQLSQAAWPYFEDQGGGRLVFLSSSAGLYGNFGQANYAAAKMAMYGLCQTIALEGAATNIACNCVAPFGATELNSANMDDAMKALVKAEYIAPLIGYLSHLECTENGSMFEASGGSFKKVRWERSEGLKLDTSKPMTIEEIARGWQQVTDFSNSEHPTSMREALRWMYET